MLVFWVRQSRSGSWGFVQIQLYQWQAQRQHPFSQTDQKLYLAVETDLLTGVLLSLINHKKFLCRWNSFFQLLCQKTCSWGLFVLSSIWGLDQMTSRDPFQPRSKPEPEPEPKPKPSYAVISWQCICIRDLQEIIMGLNTWRSRKACINLWGFPLQPVFPSSGHHHVYSWSISLVGTQKFLVALWSPLPTTQIAWNKSTKLAVYLS